MSLTTHPIQIPVFEGPLDLLLRLIEREELDITAVSLVQVTDQYLAMIEGMDRRGMADLTSFLVVAARLVLIKSRALLPRPPSTDLLAEDDDVAADLIRRLEEYRRFKNAAQQLAKREESKLRSYVRVGTPPALAPSFDLSEISLEDLISVAEEALQALPARPVDDIISQIVITIDDQIARIRGHLSRQDRTSFREVLSEKAGLVEVITTLLAVLELLKQDEVDVSQDGLFGPIVIEKKQTSISAAPAT